MPGARRFARRGGAEGPGLCGRRHSPRRQNRPRCGGSRPWCYPEIVTIPLLAIGREPLEVNRLVEAVAEGSDDGRVGDAGAVATFVGAVRNHNAGRRVQSLVYDTYEPVAKEMFEPSSREAGAR